MKVKSSMINAIQYENEDEILYVEFATGVTWKYDGVQEKVWNELKDAESVGKYFLQNIKNKYEGEKL